MFNMAFKIHSSLFSFWPLSICLLLISFFVCSSCNTKKNSTAEISVNTTSNKGDGQHTKLQINHAIGFKLDIHNDYTVLHIKQYNNDTSDIQTYILHNSDAILPSNLQGYPAIRVPISNVVLLQTAYSAYFKFCNATSAILGIADSKYIFDKDIVKEIELGTIQKVGSPEQLNIELLTNIKPEIVIGTGFPNVPNKDATLLERLGIPTLLFSDWMETDLLGRAEWVKLIAVLTGQEALVAKKFQIIENEYKSLCQKASLAKEAPIVMYNMPFKGTWYMPGGHSYIANTLKDAHGEYPWFDDTHTGGIQLDFETVFATGMKADIWINPGLATTLRDIIGVDARLTDFRPIQLGLVYNNNKRTNTEGANDYWESGLVNPHIVLADLINIMHPKLLPEHKLFYFQKLIN